MNLDKNGARLVGASAPLRNGFAAPRASFSASPLGSWLRQSRRRRDFPLRGLPVRRHEKSTNGLQLVLSPVICSSVRERSARRLGMLLACAEYTAQVLRAGPVCVRLWVRRSGCTEPKEALNKAHHKCVYSGNGKQSSKKGLNQREAARFFRLFWPRVCL